ncbi:MAG TPA: serine--tRNA ligase [Acidobacteriota bacterium]|nr:serine--tRNA ligase [Acidobacteriota bacterium]
MLAADFIRTHLDDVKQMLVNRGSALTIDEFVELDARRRQLIGESEKNKALLNRVSPEIGALMKAGKKEEADGKRAEMKELKVTIETQEKELAEVEVKLSEVVTAIPNMPHSSVPVGGESANQEVSRWGEPREFSFEPKDHVDLGVALGILDQERAVKITGARFSVLNGVGARMERALINFMLDIHTQEHGYQEMLPPFVINAASLFGTGQLPKFEADLFKLTDERGLYLAPTAEVPVTNYYRDEILDGAKLPISFTAYTPCFRSEAGSYGRDTRGLIRQHQFDKVELVKFTKPEESYAEHEKLTANAEVILQRLELPYRKVVLATGDMGAASAKTYDLEVWLPSQKTYREISSCSNFEAFQARRASIRFRREAGAKPELVHTLNGSGLAVGRTWLAILENYQQEDGSIEIPRALRPYLGGLEVIG